LAGEQKLEEAHIKAVVDLYSEFAKQEIQVINTLLEVAKDVEQVQSQALGVLKEGLSNVNKALAALAEKAEKLLINPPWPPFDKGGMPQKPPLKKGAARSAGGFAPCSGSGMEFFNNL
jgi:hypothetical protein